MQEICFQCLIIQLANTLQVEYVVRIEYHSYVLQFVEVFISTFV